MKNRRIHDACGLPWTMHEISKSSGELNWVCPKPGAQAILHHLESNQPKS